MIKTFIGYEKLEGDSHVLDLFVKESDSGFHILEPSKVPKEIAMHETVIISLSSYLKLVEKPKEEDNLSIQFFPVTNNTLNLAYLSARIKEVRDTVLFRYIEVEEKEKIYGVRVLVDEVVLYKEPINDIPYLFYNENNKLEMEEPAYREERKIHVHMDGFQYFTQESTEQENLNLAEKFNDELTTNQRLKDDIASEIEKYKAGLYVTGELLREKGVV